MYQHKLGCERLFDDFPILAQKEYAVCNESLDVAHGMHRPAEMSPMMNQGIIRMTTP
jgi:hypothetical protein